MPHAGTNQRAALQRQADHHFFSRPEPLLATISAHIYAGVAYQFWTLGPVPHPTACSEHSCAQLECPGSGCQSYGPAVISSIHGQPSANSALSRVVHQPLTRASRVPLGWPTMSMPNGLATPPRQSADLEPTSGTKRKRSAGHEGAANKSPQKQSHITPSIDATTITDVFEVLSRYAQC